MEKLKISVVYMTKEKQKKGVRILLPDNEQAGSLLQSLIEKLDLKTGDGQDGAEYVFYSVEKKMALESDKTFSQQSVQDGEMLMIKLKKRALPVQQPETIETTQKTEADVLICPICKNEVSQEDDFCSKCGQRLVAKTVFIQPAQVIEEPQEEEKTEKKKKGSAFLAALIIIILLFLTLAVGAVLEKEGIINVFSYVRFNEKPQVTVTEESSTSEETTQEPTTVDENLIMVEVTIQSDFLDEASRPSETLTKEQIEMGYTAVKINGDGSVTYKIRKSAWRKILEEFRQDMKKTVDETAGEYAFIDKITYNEDFSEFTVSVDRAKYENGFDNAICLSLYIGAGYYQMFDLKEPKCTFSITDASSGETIDTLVYPTQAN